jgi:hypothetical protein
MSMHIFLARQVLFYMNMKLWQVIVSDDGQRKAKAVIIVSSAESTKLRNNHMM